MLLYLAKQGDMWECNLKKPKSASFSAWAEMQCWWGCGGTSRREESELNGAGSEQRWGRERQGAEDSQSQGAEKGKGSLPFYFLQKLQWRLLWPWVYRTGFVHFGEEGFESEVAAKCWKQPLGRNRSKSQVAWGNLDVICVHQYEDISLSVCPSLSIYISISRIKKQHKKWLEWHFPAICMDFKNKDLREVNINSSARDLFVMKEPVWFLSWLMRWVSSTKRSMSLNQMHLLLLWGVPYSSLHPSLCCIDRLCCFPCLTVSPSSARHHQQCSFPEQWQGFCLSYRCFTGLNFKSLCINKLFYLVVAFFPLKLYCKLCIRLHKSVA